MNELLLIGICFSLIYTELTDLSPGGIIVPAYFAMYSYDPQRMITTILLSFLCMAAVQMLSRHMILYGKRRYAMYILCGVILKLGLPFLGFEHALSIGSLIPGMIGRDMERQKPFPTLLSLGIVTLFVRLAYILLR